MPLYNTASVTVALGVTAKWIDNLLSHNKIEGVQQAKQGIPRRLSLEAVAAIEIIRTLHDAGMPVSSAASLARQLFESSREGSLTAKVALSPMLDLVLDRPTLQRTLTDRLTEAIEITPHRVRGRPKQTGPKKTGRPS
jgi:hypothetical protein